MEEITKQVASYVKGKEISIKRMAKATGIPYTRLYDSLARKTGKVGRELRVSEYFKICDFLEVDGNKFVIKTS